MANGAAGAAAGAHHAVIQAIKAAGAVVRVDPREFTRLVERQDAPLVVYAAPHLFSRSHRYLCGYKGLCFFTKSPSTLTLPGSAELVRARSIWIPV
jgi:hypothetical protein